MSRTKGEGLFWRCKGCRVASSPSLLMPAWKFVAILPQRYEGADFMVFRADNGDDYLVFVVSHLPPLRFDIKREKFEVIEATDNGRWEWREYYG